MSDKVGRLRMLAVGLVIGAFAVFGLSLFKAFIPLMGVMLLKGIFWGIVYSVMPAFISDTVPDQLQGTGIGTYRTFMDMGGLVGPVVMSNLVDIMGYPQGYMYSFYFSTAICIGCLTLLAALRDCSQQLSD